MIVVAAASGYYFGAQRASSPSAVPSSLPSTAVESTHSPSSEEPVFCTMDAKVCPDGSSVGRVPPTCEFAECPSETVSDQEKFSGPFFSTSYPKYWQKWSSGRGVSYAYFQINTDTQQAFDRGIPKFATISFDVQELSKYDPNTIKDKKAALEKANREDKNRNYIISEREVDGIPALVYENAADFKLNNQFSLYEKEIFLVKDDVKYFITFRAYGENDVLRDETKEMYLNDFEKMISSTKLSIPENLESFSSGNNYLD